MPQLSRFFPCCKGSLQKQRPHKDLPPTSSKTTRTVAVISASALVFSSAGFGAVYASSVGAEHGPLLMTLMVLMAVSLECIKPLAVASAVSAFRSWGVIRGLVLTALAVVAIAYSLTSELGLMAGSRGDLAAKRASVIELSADRRTRIQAARSELASLVPSRAVAEVQADVTKLLADNPRAGDCSSLDGPVSRSICPRVAALHGEIARAERRAELQAAIDRLADAATPASTVKSADPGATALSIYLAAIGIVVPAGLLSEWLVLIPVLALEIGAASAFLLVQSLPGAAAGQEPAPSTEHRPDSVGVPEPAQQPTPVRDTQSRTSPSVPVSGQPSQQTRKRTARKSKRRTPGKGDKGGPGGQSGKRRLGNVVDLLKASGGKLKGGQRGIAKALGVSKSRVNELLHELAASGAVQLATTRYGTTVALAAA